MNNIFYVNKAYFNKTELSNFQSGFACSDNELSTPLHELIHWQDAEKYRRKYGEITDFNSYVEYLNKKFAPKLEKLQKEGYNIFDISNYATKSIRGGRFDEAYTEYRVKKFLKG